MPFDKDKLKAMAHYVAWAAPDGLLGLVKLNKIMLFADREWYLLNGQSMSGEAYVKQPHGPVPAHMKKLLDELEDEGKITIRDRKIGGYTQKEVIGLKEPEFSLLDSAQVSVLDRHMTDICRKHTARSVSDLSHDEVYEAFVIGHEIPLSAYLSRESSPTEDDLEWLSQGVPG